MKKPIVLLFVAAMFLALIYMLSGGLGRLSGSGEDALRSRATRFAECVRAGDFRSASELCVPSVRTGELPGTLEAMCRSRSGGGLDTFALDRASPDASSPGRARVHFRFGPSEGGGASPDWVTVWVLEDGTWYLQPDSAE